MKKIILVFILFHFCVIGISQQPLRYSKNLDAYVGTWEYKTATETFRVFLKKGKDYYPDGRLSSESIYGSYFYSKNGQVIANHERRVALSNEDNDNMTIAADNSRFNEADVNPNVLRLVFVDVAKEKRGLGALTLIQGDTLKLHWQITRTAERIFIGYEGEEPPSLYDTTWSVPIDVVLTRTGGPPSSEMEVTFID